MTIVAVTAIANWISIDSVESDDALVSEVTLWAGGFGILGLGTIKVAIAVVLIGIIKRLWVRVDSMRDAVPRLHPRPGAADVSPVRRALVTSADIPRPLPIHAMATRMWRPMLLMGAMAVVIGAIVRAIAAGEGAGTESFRETAAWGIGLEFLGEAMLLSGIAFLLGTILASLRQGGAEVQKAAGGEIRVLRMPATGKAFVALTMTGLMVGVAQFIASVVLSGRADDVVGYGELTAFIGPLREFSLGLILAGIVLALVTIGNVLSFQFDRVRQLIRNN
ncbi:MAG: hypothetical protein ACR2P0_02770 [Acidimicrobiales bacterium]